MSKLWLPFTQMQSFDASQRTFVRAFGSTLVDSQGRHLFDATSSIWTTIHGHAHPVLLRALGEQAARLDHVTALGASNPPAEALAQKLCALSNMDAAFFSSDGASSVEAAIKMALQYWQRRGQPQRTRFLRLDAAYHGDTAAAMSVSDIATFKTHFGAITFETHRIEDLDAIDLSTVAATIVEPLVQAAAGMRIVPASSYAALDARDTLLIVDEIATGFGRTGTMFASEQLQIAPDIICVGKGLTGGILALSAALVKQHVYDAFLGGIDDDVQFFHGHSYAANPIACAVANASLDLFESEATLDRANALAERMKAHNARMNAVSGVCDARAVGTMGAIELANREAARRIAVAMYARGHFTRATGNVVQLVPPLCATLDEIDAFYQAFESSAA